MFVSCGIAFTVICMQTGMPTSPAQFHAGKERGSSTQSNWLVVLPAVNRRIPVSLRPTQ